MSQRSYDLSTIFSREANVPTVLLVLNSPITRNDILSQMCKVAAYIVCADGGANRFLDSDYQSREGSRLPDVIVGDLDSLRPNVATYYEDQGVPVIRDEDQYSTDLMKCIKHIRSVKGRWLKEDGTVSKYRILIYGSLGGRVDQGLGLLSALKQYLHTDEHEQLYLVTESSISFILDQHYLHEILGVASGGTDLFTENVGIIPIFGPASISMVGFEWDVEDWDTEMGGNISTSNHIRNQRLEIRNKSNPVLFTIEIRPELPY